MSKGSDGLAIRLLLTLILLMACLVASNAYAQQVVGTITNLTGSAQITRASATISVVQGIQVQLNDRLATSSNSGVVVTLNSGSTLTLGERTSLTFDQTVTGAGASGTLVNMLQGALRSVVAVTAPSQEFVVHTPNAVAAVRGTDFDVTYIEGRVRPGYRGCQRYTDVRVRNGIVEVSNRANPTQIVDVEAGFETTVPCLLPPLTAGPLGIAGAVGPGGAGGRSSSGGGAAAAVVGFSAPPPGAGSSAPPPPPPPPPSSISPVSGP